MSAIQMVKSRCAVCPWHDSSKCPGPELNTKCYNTWQEDGCPDDVATKKMWASLFGAVPEKTMRTTMQDLVREGKYNTARVALDYIP